MNYNLTNLHRLLLALMILSLYACTPVSTPPLQTGTTAASSTAPAYPPAEETPLFPAPTQQNTPTRAQPSLTASAPTQTQQISLQTATPPLATATGVLPGNVTPTAAPTSTDSVYPPPDGQTGSGGGGNSYPPPQSTAVPGGSYPYPPAEPTSTQGLATQTPSVPPSQPTSQATDTPVFVTPGAGSSIIGTPEATVSGMTISALTTTLTTTATIAPTEAVPGPLATTIPGAFTTVTIWHSWSDAQVLEQAARVFQSGAPDVTFALRYVPFDELEQKYRAEAYYGGGPTLVMGVSEWGARLYADGLVENVAPYISPIFESTLNPNALGTTRVNDAVFGLPFGLRGPVLYRNQLLIPQASATFTDLLSAAGSATRAGNVGLYLDWGMAYAGGFLQGQGGRWLNDQQQPLFQQNDYRFALQWLGLARTASQAGALIGFNERRDLSLFRQGRVGMIVESSDLRFSLAQTLGEENLAIDPWPTVDGGRMTGFVESNVVYLNTNAGLHSAREKQAGLQFMGLLMTPAVQKRLAELGIIPSVPASEPRSRLTAEAAAAFATGTALPAIWQDELRSAYWTALDAASQAALQNQTDPLAALQRAYEDILQRFK